MVILYLVFAGVILYLAYRFGLSLLRVALVVGGVFVLWKTGLLLLIARVIRTVAYGIFHFIITHFGTSSEQAVIEWVQGVCGL